MRARLQSAQGALAQPRARNLVLGGRVRDGQRTAFRRLARPKSEVACVFDTQHPPPKTIGDPGSGCLFQGLTTDFAIYGGQHPIVSGTPDQPASQVDMAFSWEVIGGFSPLTINLSALGDASTLPQSMVFSPQLKDLVIADGASKGLVLVDLSTFGLSQYY